MIRAIAAALVLLAATAACSVRTAGGVTGPYTATATFTDVQSLVVGHSVQIADVKVGTVTAIGLDGFRAKVTMSLRRRIPTGTSATIARTSLLGENYVRLDLPAGRTLAAGPFLPDGAALGRTAVAPDLEQISADVGPLLAAFGGQDAETIVTTSADAVGGQGRRLNGLIKQLAGVSDDYAAASEDLGRALDALGSLGHTLHGGDAKLDALPGDVLVATQRLQADRARLKQGVQDLLTLGKSFNATIQERHAARLRVLLQRADTVLASAVRGRDQLKTLAQTVLAFLRSPSVSTGGQGLLFVWLKGFLPPDYKAPTTSSLDLQQLAGPRP